MTTEPAQPAPSGRRRALLLDGAMVLFVLVLGVVLARPGVFTVDESHYLLAAQALAERGSFGIQNGYEQTGAEELLVFYTVVPARVAELGTVSTVPPYHAAVAAPLFLLAGLSGLVWLNLLAFAATLLAVRRIASRVMPAGPFSRVAVVAFGLGTFGLEYALGIWPHALSQSLVAWAVLSLLVAGEGGPRALAWAVLAGALGGVATGVRLQNILLLPVLLLAGRLWLRLGWKSVATCLGAWLIPLAGQAAINLHRLDTWNPFSYGASASWATSLRGRVLGLLGTHPWILVVALGIVLAAWWLWHRTRRKTVWIGLGAASLAVVLLVPATRDLLWRWLMSLGFHLVDTAFIPGGAGSVGGHVNELGQVLYGGVLKKGLLEAAPWLALALLAPFTAAGRELRFLAGAGLMGALIVPLVVGRGGLCYNPRYLLEITPALAVVSLAILARLGPGRLAWIGGALAGVVAAMPSLLHPGSVDRPAGGWLGLLVPLALAVATLATAGVAIAGGGGRRVFLSRAAAGLAVASIVFAALVHLRVDLARSLDVRRLATRIHAQGLAVIPPPPGRSVLLVPENMKDVFSALKLDRDVWLARVRPGDEELPAFVGHLPADRRLFALANGIPPERFGRWIRSMRARQQVRQGLVFVELAPGGTAP